MQIEGVPVLLGGDILLAAKALPSRRKMKASKDHRGLSKLNRGDSVRVRVLRGGKILDLKAGYYKL